MRIFVESVPYGAYELTPLNQRFAKKFQKETGYESILIQSDWDFPSLAKSFGWNMGRTKECDHKSTDGTVDCRQCGKTASEFISEAQDHLDKFTDTIVTTHRFPSLGEYFGSKEKV